MSEKMRFLIGRPIVGGYKNPMVIVVDKTDKIASESDLIDALRVAVGKWMHETDEGLSASAYTCGDFNFGDLAVYLDRTLATYIEQAGVSGFELHGLTTPNNATLDTVLEGPNTDE